MITLMIVCIYLICVTIAPLVTHYYLNSRSNPNVATGLTLGAMVSGLGAVCVVMLWRFIDPEDIADQIAVASRHFYFWAVLTGLSVAWASRKFQHSRLPIR